MARLIDKIWLCDTRAVDIIYDTGSEFKLQFETQRKSTTIKNPKANAILWARPSDPRNDDAHLWNRPGQFVVPAGIDTSIDNTAWAFR